MWRFAAKQLELKETTMDEADGAILLHLSDLQTAMPLELFCQVHSRPSAVCVSQAFFAPFESLSGGFIFILI
jgi:hypothetical protein